MVAQRRTKKLQSAMEYLMTYGWAILIVAVVLAVLYQLGFFSGTNFITTSCIAESGFTCQKPVMNATGYVQVDIGQISNGTMTVTGYACTNNTQSPSSFNTYSGTMALVSGQVQQAVVKCPGVGGKIGSTFRGYIWIQYNFAGQTGLVAQIAVLSAVAMTTGAVPLLLSTPLYCMGGWTGSAYSSATYNSIISLSGTIGAWKSASSYPTPLGDSGCVGYGNDAYCVAGIDNVNGGYGNNVYYAPISLSSIGSWTFTGNYPISEIALPDCVASGGYVYCIGGSISGVGSTNAVYYAPVSSTGIGTWIATTAYPVAQTDISCDVYAGYIYCVGGGGTSAVYSASISSGGIGSWATQTSYPLAVSSPGCEAAGGYMYCVGGSPTISNTFYASIASGTIGSWSATVNYPIDIERTSCVFNSGDMYCVGGYSSGDSLTSNVYYGAPTSGGISGWTALSSYPIAVGEFKEDCVT